MTSLYRGIFHIKIEILAHLSHNINTLCGSLFSLFGTIPSVCDGIVGKIINSNNLIPSGHILAIFLYNLLIVALQHVPVKHIGSKETRLASGQADFLNESFPFFG